MEALIKEQLEQIERERGVRILYACESGSRAWGFPSPDSDFDVRFIYVHSKNWYLSLRDRKDTIELPINDELDISGWDLRKVLQLLRKSNAPLQEWLNSPIVYKAMPGFKQDVQHKGKSCFSAISTMHHYLSMSKRYFARCLETEEVKLKHYFYTLRAALAGKWIRTELSMPPTEFLPMLDLMEEGLKQKVLELMRLKSEQEESYLHPGEKELNKFLKDTIEENEASALSLLASKPDIDRLDEILLHWLL